MEEKKLLLLNGSPRKKGTSFTFARTLSLLTAQTTHKCQIVHVYDYFDGKEDFNNLIALIAESSEIGLIAPLYVDTLPYPDIWLLEKLQKANQDRFLEGKGFFAIGQCGFPDITRCEPLLNACRFFAEECQMIWLGGLAYGGGAIINGARLEDLNKKGEKMIQVLKMALQSVLENQPIKQECQQLFTLKIPKFLFRPLALYLNNMSKKEAQKHGVKDLKVKAYL